MGHIDIASTIVIASAFGDAANKVLGYLREITPALIAVIIVSAACALVFSKGHKAEILLSALAACVLLVSYATIGAGL
jgi:mannose/fructose/N-acetylgalactosamine-specific phosphotransferase system component IID